MSLFRSNLFLNNDGFGILPFILIISLVLFIGQQFMMMDQQNTFKGLLYTQNIEAQKSLIANLETLVADELALRNSRFSINYDYFRCLYANPSACDETQYYDMVLFSPNPPITYGGGAWPTAPAGISMIAGGLNANKILYTRAAGICNPPPGEPNNGCPLQAIIRFKPLCGGTPDNPQPQATPGPCPGRATGLDISIGVGVYKNGQFTYRNDTSIYGDTKLYRIKSMSLMN